MFQHKNAFEQASNARGCLEVPDVRFDGANVKVIRPGNTLAEDLVNRRNFFSVAYLSSLTKGLLAQAHCPVWDTYGAVSLDE
jgi:hypothetical protein